MNIQMPIYWSDATEWSIYDSAHSFHKVLNQLWNANVTRVMKFFLWGYRDNLLQDISCYMDTREFLIYIVIS